VFTKSRAVATAVAMSVARCAASRARAFDSCDSAVMARRPPSFGAVLALRKSVNR
jgi:hypothetical protein